MTIGDRSVALKRRRLHISQLFPQISKDSWWRPEYLLPSGLFPPMRLCLCFVYIVIGLLGSPAALPLSIDQFDAAQGPVTGAGNSSYTSDATILGGERDVYLQFFPTTSTFQISNGKLTLSQTSGYSDVFVTYDGTDASPNNALGLGGLNLLANANAFEIAVLPTRAKEPHATILIRVYSSSSDYSEFQVVLDAPDFPSVVNVPFNTMQRPGLGANFANVKAIQFELSIGSSINMDLNIDYIAMVLPPGPLAIVDFQRLEQSDTGTTNLFFTYPEKSFIFADTSGTNGLGSFHTTNPNYAGSTMLFNNSQSDTSLSRTDSSDFDFFGIDLAPLDAQYPTSGPITFYGYRGTHPVVSETFNFNGNAGVQHFAPQQSFAKITELRWLQGPPYHQFDNVQVRQNGLPPRGPQIEVGVPDSSVPLGLSRLKVGMSYSLQTSTDLSTWQNGYSFPAYSAAKEVRQVRMGGRGFYKLRPVY